MVLELREAAGREFHYYVSSIFQSINSQGTAVAQWLRRCAINRKVAGSIPDGVIEIFLLTLTLTMALESTQPLTEMSTRRISWG